MSIVKLGNAVAVPFQIDQATQIGNVRVDLVSPIDGFITEVHAVVQAVPTTGGTIQVRNPPSANASDNVAGAVVTIANAAAKGTKVQGLSTPGGARRRVARGAPFSLVLAGFATAGATNGLVVIRTSLEGEEAI